MKNKFFEEINNNFGFGCMRLPMLGNEIDLEETKKMVDEFIKEGFNYFDTAHGYIGGKSELAIKECLTKRYPREKFILTNKLTDCYFNNNDDIWKVFYEQLEACGVDYFDFYLMHAMNRNNFYHYKNNGAYDTLLELKKEGKIRHIGMSFHDTSDVLDNILNEFPEIEVVQIQLNYLDYYDQTVQSKACYDVCVKHNKPCIIMEPVKGGILANVPEKAQKIFYDLNNGTPASYAIRFAASHSNVMMVLSGMSNLNQMCDNLSYMKDFKPLNDKENEAIQKVVDVFKSRNSIQCTNCRYCVEGCPQNILIPDIFAARNSKDLYNEWTAKFYYNAVITTNNGKASDCIKCGHCERKCPQKLEIRKLLEEISREFDN